MGIKARCYSLVVLLVLLIPALANASPGVGVGTGKIILNEALGANTSYSLPSMMVYNDGDEASQYEMAVTFNEKQPELKPSANWVSFSPQNFTLTPGEAQQVDMTITLPASVKAGDYYAYLEAHTVAGSSQETHISAAAAAKFYFSAQNNMTPTLEAIAPPKKQATSPPKNHPSTSSQALTQFGPLLDQITKNMSQS